MDSRWISFVFLFFIIKTSWSLVIAPCRSIDSLYIGCYSENPSDREFLVSAGNYNSSELYPGLCVGICGFLSFKYSALQNGYRCLCGNTFGRHGQLSGCNISCPADAKRFCGGKMANSVYNSSGLVGVFSINQPDKPFILFNKANLTISCTNCTSESPGFAVDDGQGTGFSEFSSENSKFSYMTTMWGTKTIRARNSFAKDLKTLQSKVKITAMVKHLKIDCSLYVKIGEQFQCNVLVYQGTDMKAEWKFAEGTSGNLSLSDPIYQGVGPPIPQWTLTSISSLYDSGVFLIPSSVFINDAVFLGVEVHGHTAGTVSIFIARPRCLMDNQKYCVNNGTCVSSSQECPAIITRQQCTAPETLSLSSSSCQNTAFCNSTLSAPAMYQSAVSSINYTIVCLIRAITIKTGYNLYVLPDDKVCHTKKGDILGWAIDGAGRIAHRNDNKKVLRYTAIPSPTSVGQNITHDIPYTEIAVEYLVKVVGAEGAVFKTQHTINKVGSDYLTVQVTNNMMSLPVTSVREIRGQQPLSWISGAYFQGFSYFGVKKPAPVELIVNVSSATNVTVTCKNITSGEVLFNFVNLPGKPGIFFLAKANHSFDQEGFFELYIEASNEISSVNTTINVLLPGDISGLNANLSQPEQPVYMGVETGLVAASASSYLRYKWLIGNDEIGFLESNTTTYNFKQEGWNKVILIATNLAFISNVSFTVRVMNPLRITSPAWNATNKAITFSSELKGAFNASQYYMWSFGDGSTKNGINFKSVQHTYTKGGHFNVSCRIQNEAPIISTRTIFILEPVTGDCLLPLDGVRLGDNKTFIAQYSTGNNLTFDWALQGSTFAMLAICPDRYFSYQFKKHGGYNITLKISNAISSISCYKTFFVDEKIQNVSIKAYPNPAPSNSTVRFEISKKNGTNIRYDIDFGDRNFIRSFDGPQWEYNRTFTAGKWQVILTANNSLGKEIVFYSLIVQDVIKNISITVDHDGMYLERPYVAIGVTKAIRCQADQGTDVFFDWTIEENKYKDKGDLQKSGQSVVLRRQTFYKEKEIGIIVNAYNLISNQSTSLTIVSQLQIEDFDVEAPKGVSLNEEFILNFQNKGSNVAYRIRFDDGTPDITTKNSYVKKSFNSQREFAVYVWAFNQVSNVSVSKTIAVQTKIEGMMAWPSKLVAAVNEPITLYWNISKGSDVTFLVDFNDGPVNQINGTSHPVGKIFSISQSCKTVKTFIVIVTARNHLGQSQTQVNLQIEEAIQNLRLVSLEPKQVNVFHPITVEVTKDKGSHVKFTFDFGDGLGPVKSDSSKVSYKYRYPGRYTVNITGSNPISSRSIAESVQVISDDVQAIEGLQVIAKATRFGEESHIYIISEGGTNYDCEVSGEDLKINLKIKYDDLKNPFKHTYTKAGSYVINVKCENKLSSRTASVTTTVEQTIEGLQFEEDYQSKEIRFGEPHEFKWSWTRGSHVRCTAYILSKEDIVKTITRIENCKSISILPGYVEVPGMYTLRIEIQNSVTPTLSLSVDIFLVEKIAEVRLNVNPHVRSGYPAMMFLDMKAGTRATSVWMYGEGNGAEIQRSKSPSDRFIRSMRTFKSPGVYNITVVVWNCFSSNATASATVTIINPVTGFQAVLLLKKEWPVKNVQFQFSRNNNTAAPTNANFEFEFGDGSAKSPTLPLNSSQLDFTYNYEYKEPGCYTAKLRIFNQASDAKFTIQVKIEEKIENLTLQAVQSVQSPSPRMPGFGKNGNFFPKEYPVSFRAGHSKGTCVSYEWSFGDNETVPSDSLATDHRYALPGNYKIQVSASNKRGVATTSLDIGIRWSIVGLYVVSSSPSKPGDRVTFIVFCAQIGNNSNFVLDTGDNHNITLNFTSKGNGQNEMKQYISTEVKLPFIPSTYYSAVTYHTYNEKGVYETRAYAWNEVSQKTAKTHVVITEKNCAVPGIILYGGGDTLEKASKIKYGREFRIDSRTNISCSGEDGKTIQAKFEWDVFKADEFYFKNASGPPEEGRKINNLLSDVMLNTSTITISMLEPGFYLLRLTVTLSTIGITNSAQRYIQVMTPNVEAIIKGGSARSRGWEVDVILDASGSYDPLNKNLTFEWRCALGKETKNEFIFGKGGCFGNGNNIVESEEPVFTIRNRSLFESVTYSFTVTVTPKDDEKRAGQFTQEIKIVEGKPPDINIRCLHNCAKKITSDEQLTLEAYCTDCIGNSTELEFLWSAENVTSNEKLELWPSYTLTSRTLQYVVVKKNIFLQDKEYMLKVQAKRKGGSSGFAKLKFQTNSPPRDGNCKFEKNEIEELKTLHVSCENWKEDDTPLSYEVLIKKNDNQLLLWYGPELRDCKVILEAGKKENDYKVQLIARVKDVYGAVTDTIHNITVKPISEINKEVFEDSSNVMSNLLASGDAIGAVQLTSALGSIVNERAENITTKDKEKIRSRLVQEMAKVDPSDLQAVRQLTGSLETVTKQPEEIVVQAQVDSTNIYSRAVHVISRTSKRKGFEPAQIELASGITFSAISNTLAASATSSEKIFENTDGPDSDLEKAKSSSSKLVEITALLGSATLNGKVPGENATKYEANKQTLTVKKIPVDDLEATGIQEFNLPGKDVLLDGLDERHDHLGLMVSSLPLNPFGGTNSSKMIESETMSLVVSGNNSKELKIEGLSSYIDIFLQNKQLPGQENAVNVTRGSSNITVHKIFNIRVNTSIFVDVIPQNRSTALNVYFKYSGRPTRDNYDLMTSLPRFEVNQTGNITSPGPFTFQVPSEYVNVSGDYYIGVSSVLNDTSSFFNYTFDLYVAGCYYWDGRRNIWSCDGCKVGNKTSREVTHCQCTHLTWFGGDLFIPPNKLDVLKAINGLKDLDKSWPLLITIGVVGGLYILAMIWARRQDRKDLTKVGLIVVPDSDPSDRFRYEVTVYTGRMARGTTSNLSMILYGDLNESHPIALKDKTKPIFGSGSVDSFLVTVPVALGSLNYIRIWHDNSGIWPAWYLNQVIIRDIDTDERFVFLCYRWFACDEDDGQVVRLVPVAGKEDLREFTYLFKNRAKKDFTDAHLWFSIALRPPRSMFTRVQRISCCFSLLLCTMLTNAMWYGLAKGNPQNDTIIFKSGFIVITWREILIGIQASLVVFPINLLIVQIFRNTQRKPKKKRKPEEAIKLEPAKTKNDQILTLNDIHAVTRSESSQSNFISARQDKALKKSLTLVKKVQTKSIVSREDSFDEDLLLLLRETQMIDEPQIGKGVRSFEKLSDKDSIDLEPLDIVKEQPTELRKQHSISPASESSFDFSNDNSKLVKPSSEPKVKIKIPKLKFLFPWWFVYVGWFLCFFTSTVSAFFVILYGSQMEIKKQQQWLVSMFISIAQDIFISQPLKVLGFAMFFALIWKKPEKEDDTLTAELAKDEEWLKENVGGRRRNALIAHRPKYLPPDEIMLKKARIRRFKERKMFSVIREIALYAMFVWVVLVVAYGHRDPNSEVLNQGIENMLTGKGNSWLVDYTRKKSKNETLRKFLKVSGVDKYWNWTRAILLPSLYNGPWYNGEKDNPGFMADRSSWVVGVARIRQLRVKTDSCEVSKVFQGSLRECNEPYSWTSEDTTNQFRPGWLRALPNYTTPNQAWMYRTGTALKSLPFLGRLAFYSGGGYAEDLGPTLEVTKKKIEEMEANNWIDKLTRAVFVEVTIYNSNTNLYCVIFLVLEVSASGGTFPFVELLITRIDRYAGNFMIFVLIFELAFVVFVLFFTYKLFKGALKIGPRYYFKRYWSWVELGLVSLCWTSIALYFVRFGINTMTQTNYRKTPNEFVNFHHLAVSDQLFGYVYAFVVFLVSLKFLRLFRFNRRMSLLASTLHNASKELWCFSLVFGIVFMAFVHFCYMVFSNDLYMFHTVMSSAETLISVMLGKFSYERLLQTNRILAPLMFFFYSLIVVFVLINMFISIIIENFQVVKRNNDLQSNEYEIVDFMMDQFKIWLGWSSWGVIFSKNKVSSYPMGKPKYKKPKRETETDKLNDRIDRLIELIQEVYFDEPDFLANDAGEVTLKMSSHTSLESKA